MTTIAFLIERLAPGLYILTGVGIFIYWRRWMAAQRDYRATVFELERDYASYRRANAFTIMVVLLQFGLFVAGVQNVVAPQMREDREVRRTMAMAVMPIEDVDVEEGEFATSTPPAFLQPPPIDASGIELGDENAPQIFATPTLTPTPVGTIESAPPVIGCDTPYAQLQIPANGMVVFKVEPVRGVAYYEDFSVYKFEISPAGQNQFSTTREGIVPVEELGTLGQFDPSPYPEGLYDFRLMVFNTATELVASCQVTIRISRPIPTPTPIS
ncbi:MAG: hypothetical protein Kow00117_02740 [Phototrophicales bacterium]|nr:MAG: hypothetical protein CUN56_03410 [Phototrophicales bacterium]RMG76154.1 MAG: hypothetical protein D6711_04615 [Chloroflexota bacterium]